MNVNKKKVVFFNLIMQRNNYSGNLNRMVLTESSDPLQCEQAW